MEGKGGAGQTDRRTDGRTRSRKQMDVLEELEASGATDCKEDVQLQQSTQRKVSNCNKARKENCPIATKEAVQLQQSDKRNNMQRSTRCITHRRILGHPFRQAGASVQVYISLGRRGGGVHVAPNSITHTTSIACICVSTCIHSVTDTQELDHTHARIHIPDSSHFIL